jgi:hypothetical protein
MKRSLLVAAGALLSLGAGLAASAQSSDYVVSVPFSFHIGKQALPGGTYYVSRRSSLGSMVGVNTIRQAGEAGIVLPTVANLEAKDKTAAPKLVFHRYNGVYFLSQVWDGSGLGKQLATSSEETEMATKEAPKDLTIAGR